MTRSTLISLLIALMMCVIAWVWLQSGEDHAPIGPGRGADLITPQTDRRATAPLIESGLLEFDRVRKIVYRRYGESVAFERQGEHWWQTKPTVHPANSTAIRQSLAELVRAHEFPSDAVPDFSQAGSFAEGEPELALYTIDAEEGFGLTPLIEMTGGRAWVRLSWHDAPDLTHIDVYRALTDFDPAHWRQAAWPPVDASQLTDLRVRYGPDSFLLLREPEGWRMPTETSAVLTPAQIAKWLEAMQTEPGLTEVESVDDAEALGAYGLDRPYAMFALNRLANPPAARSMSIALGDSVPGATGQRYANFRFDDTPGLIVMLATPRLTELLRVHPDTFRDPTLLDESPQAVTRLEIFADGEIAPRLAVKRHAVDGRWIFDVAAAPEPAFFDPRKIDDALSLFADETPAVFVDAPRARDGAWTYRMETPSGEQTVHVHPDGRLWRPGWTRAVQRPESIAKLGMDQPDLAWRTLRLDWPGPHAPQNITIQQLSARHTLTRDDSGAWSMDDPIALDSRSRDYWLGLTRRVPLDRWLPATASPSVSQLPLSLSFTNADGRTFRLAVDPQTGLASAEGLDLDATPVVRRVVIEMLQREARHPVVLPISARDITEIAIIAGPNIQRIQPDAQGLWVNEQGFSWPQAPAAALIDTLAGLRVQRYLDRPSPQAEPINDILHLTTGPNQTFTLQHWPKAPTDLGGSGLYSLANHPMAFTLRPEDEATLHESLQLLRTVPLE